MHLHGSDSPFIPMVSQGLSSCCLLTGSVCLQWHWLMFFVMARIKWTVHLHLILCTQDAVNNSIQVTSTWDAVSLKKKKMDMRLSQDLNLGLLNSSQMFLLTEQQEFWHGNRGYKCYISKDIV